MLKTPAGETHGGYNYLVRLSTRFRVEIGWGLPAAVIRAVGVLAAITVIMGCQDVHVIAIRVKATLLDAAIEAPVAVDAAIDRGSVADVGMTEIPVNVVCPPSALPGVPPQGFAAWTGPPTMPTLPTTGGQGGQVVTAATLEDVMAYAAMTVPLVIQIGTTISLTGQIPNMVLVQSNKTIKGIAKGAGLTGGGLLLYNAENIIVQNLSISKSLGNDAITVQNARRIWIDHCDLSSEYDVPSTVYDGLIDIVHGSDFVTVSWNHFHDHQGNSLVGHSTVATAALEDIGHLTVTYHHNWFFHVRNHSPRVRFGSVHVFNNLYQDIAGTAVISQMDAAVYVERNVFFPDVIQPILTHYKDPTDGFAAESGNSYDPLGGVSQIPAERTTTWRPPYPYNADSTADVLLFVPACAGPQSP